MSCNEGITFLLVTANVGSMFEDPDGLFVSWLSEFLKTVDEIKPHFIALHCQELGGKNYQQSMKHVKNFVESLNGSEQLKQFNSNRIFLDEDYSNQDSFTALANFYFLHSSLKNIQIFNFKEKKFYSVEDKVILDGNLDRVEFIDKSKYPVHVFPECTSSRKGFMRTRWSLNEIEFDLVNIHLFHDASNIIAMEESPSSYSQLRQRALQYTIDRLENESLKNAPLFIFGDFNFRLDTKGLIQHLTKDHQLIEHKGDEDELITFVNPLDGKVTLKVGKKVFDLSDYEAFENTDNQKTITDLDSEMKHFQNRLFEMQRDFPPSYPFVEDNQSSSYMKTRCPAWCDRILLDMRALKLLQNNLNGKDLNKISYKMIGQSVPMGDHKPIMLSFRIAKDLV